MTKSDRWILSEYRVACDREARFLERMVAHRFRTPYAEVDLIFETNAGPVRSRVRPGNDGRSYTMIEVKSVNRDLWGRPPLTARQRLRLERARFWLESRKRCRVRLLLACVTNVGTVTYFEFPL